MSWFKLRRDDNVAGRDLRIEAVRVKRETNTPRMDGTQEIDETHGSEGSDA